MKFDTVVLHDTWEKAEKITNVMVSGMNPSRNEISATRMADDQGRTELQPDNTSSIHREILNMLIRILG